MLPTTAAHRAAVRAAFAPLITQAEKAGWTREVGQLRDVVEVGSELPSFWQGFVITCANMITVRRRIATNLGLVDPEQAEAMVKVMRDLPGDLTPHAESLATLLAYLTGTATLYSEAVALAMRFGGCGSS